MGNALEGLFQFLDRLEGRVPLEELTAQLEQHDIDCSDVADFIHFSDQSYTRNLVRSGSWYQVLVLCWKNGQRSPIHDHAGSSCGIRVLRGTLTESLFEFAPNGHVFPTFSRQMMTGEVQGSQDSDLHQVSNLQEEGADLITLHVYSPPLQWMGTYSLIERKRGKEPMFMEFSEAAGI